MSQSSAGWLEYAARAFEPARRHWPTPGDLARHLDPKTRQTTALELIDEHLVTLPDTPDGRLLCPCHSRRAVPGVSRWFPLWGLTQNPDRGGR